MRWLSTVSDHDTLDAALSTAVADLRAGLGGEDPDLVVAFVSAGYPEPAGVVALSAGLALNARHFLGCSAGGVIGGGKEVELRPAVSLTAAVLPDVDITTFHLETGTAPGQDAQSTAGPIDTATRFIVLADPFTFDTERFARQIDARFPGGRVVGGLASGGRQPGANVLLVDSDVHRSGAVGVALSGAIDVDILVAQGCRPIGSPMFVTRCRQNVIEELDGRRPYDVLTELFQTLPRRDQDLFRHSLFLGMVMRSAQQQYHHGDFLIRNILGLDRENGVLVVGAVTEERSVVQFHLRDAETSSQDLTAVLQRYCQGPNAGSAAGALMFSCLGRGMHLYGEPDHDTHLLQQHLGALPVGGFFCNGEIGPVNGQTFLHGYTSSIGVFRAPAPA